MLPGQMKLDYPRKVIAFTIPIIPKAQMRPRARKMGKHASIHKAPQQERNEEQIMGLLERYRPREPMLFPVEVVINAYLPIPRSWSGKKQHAAADFQILPTTTPDLDNLIKNILDCMTVLSFWDDDSQIVMIIATKKYSRNPRWEIKIKEM